MLHFKYTRVAVSRIDTRTLEIKNNNNEADSFFRLNLNVYIGVDNRESARVSDKKKTKETNFVWRITWKFYSGCEKMRNASDTKVKTSGSEKRVDRTTYNISSIKRVPRKFLEVSCCHRVKQRQRNVQKVCCTCKVVFFFLLVTPFFFWLFSLPSPLG